MKPDLHIVGAPAVPTTVAEAQALVTTLAAKQANAFETALADLIEMAGDLAGADSAQPAWLREIARRVAARNGEEMLTLRALIERAAR